MGIWETQAISPETSWVQELRDCWESAVPGMMRSVVLFLAI